MFHSLIIISVTLGLSSSIAYVPSTWSSICSKSTSVIHHKFPQNETNSGTVNLPLGSSANHITLEMNLSCVVNKSETLYWKLMDLRAWSIENGINFDTTPSNRSVIYNIHVSCKQGANISIPWPMRVPGLKELHVRSCLLTERYANYGDPLTAATPDELVIYDIRNSVWLMDPVNSIVPNNLTSEYDCGQDSTLEILIMRNVSLEERSEFDFPKFLNNITASEEPIFEPSDFLPNTNAEAGGPVKPEDRLIKDSQVLISDSNTLSNDDEEKPRLKEISLSDIGLRKSETASDAEKNIFELIKQIERAHTRCHYTKLKHLDESISPLTALTHFEFMVQGAEYPVLTVMNYSRIGLRKLPRELSEWRRYFPELKLIDLSHNYLSEVDVRDYPPEPHVGTVTFNLQYNNFTVINMDMIKTWASVNSFHVDVRNNPIDCNCDIKEFLKSIHKSDTFTGNLQQYKYIRDLRCNTPKSLSGRKLFSIQFGDLPCPVFESHLTALIVIGVVAAVILILIALTIIFKAEIRVLLYTRLYIRLPCDVDSSRNNKSYDAFVSYSNEDDAWVYENVVKFLEQSDSKVLTSSNNNNKTISKTSRQSGIKNSDKTPFRLCIHQRDFIPGKTIFDNIVDSIEASRHTIIVLSPRFMKSHWAMEELRQAYRQSLVEKTRHLIVVLLEKVPKEEMDPLISRCCKTFTYLDVHDSFFKDRLVFSLTTKDKGAKKRDRLAAREQRKSRSLGQVESNAYDNIGYEYSFRPTEPMRELSNTSTSSTTALTGY